MLPAASEDRFRYFVDRDEEMRSFLEMLDGGSKRILTVSGDEGVGKSFLMERMVHECALRKLRAVKIVCRELRNDALFIMRSIRDDLTVECFEAFTRALHHLTAPSVPPITVNINAPVTVGDGLSLAAGAQAGDVSGIKIVTRDLMVDRPDVERRDKERLAQLTDAFIEGLRAAVGSGPVAVFIDDCQKMMPETNRWLRDELLFQVSAGRLPNAWFVLLTQQQGDLDAYGDWTQQAQLGPFSREHIAAYLQKRGIGEPVQRGMAEALWIVTQGRIARIIPVVETYLREQRRSQ